MLSDNLMNYSSQRLANGRWGIYQQGKLLATIGCYSACQEILIRLRFQKSNNSNKTKGLPSLQVTTQKMGETAESNIDKDQTAA